MEYEYDSWNRIQNMTYPDGEVVSYEYNKGGMLQRVTGNKNGQAYTYIDSLLYNKFELKERVLYGNGTKSCYHYDILLRMDTLWSWNGTASHNPMQAIAYTYDGVGNITNITNSAAKINGIGGPYHVDYTYDGLYRMTHAEGWHGSESNFYDMQMGYYPNGRIQHKKLTRPDICCRNCICIYDNGYNYVSGNRLNRIEPLPIPTVQPGGGTVAPEPGTGSGDPTTVQINYDYSFQWDGAGNMMRQTDNIHNSVRQLSWDAENRLQGVKDNAYLSLYLYDANGERTYKLTGSYVAQNRSGVWRSYYSLTNATLYASPYLVATVKGYTKHYYAENERIASRIGDGGLSRIDTPIVDLTLCTWKLSANSTYFDTVAQNRLSAPNYITTNLLDTLYHWKIPHGNTEPDCYWYHPDHLGSASWVTSSNGDVVQYLYYLPWGEDYLNQRRNGYAGARHTFSAKERDTETGLSYFGSRYYSSDLSIWLSVDPMSDKYPSLSPYVYCANNPIKLVDPNGMQWETPEDELRSQSMIKKAESNIEANIHKINVILNKGELKEKDKRKLDDLIHQNEYLSEGIANLKDMGLCTEETYHFSDRENIDQGEGGVQKRQDGVIDIIQSGDAMAWHECVHIGDYRKNLNWNFNEKNGFLGTSKDNFAASEYKAYESQFSFDNNSLKYTNGAVVDKLSNVKRWVDFHGYNIK